MNFLNRFNRRMFGDYEAPDKAEKGDYYYGKF